MQRRKEVDAKIESMITSAFGSPDRLDDMYEIQALAVSPDKQGRGYGTALVNTVLAKVRPNIPLGFGTVFIADCQFCANI